MPHRRTPFAAAQRSYVNDTLTVETRGPTLQESSRAAAAACAIAGARAHDPRRDTAACADGAAPAVEAEATEEGAETISDEELEPTSPVEKQKIQRRTRRGRRGRRGGAKVKARRGPSPTSSSSRSPTPPRIQRRTEASPGRSAGSSRPAKARRFWSW